jgi:hypothetical protein
MHQQPHTACLSTLRCSHVAQNHIFDNSHTTHTNTKQNEIGLDWTGLQHAVDDNNNKNKDKHCNRRYHRITLSLCLASIAWEAALCLVA